MKAKRMRHKREESVLDAGSKESGVTNGGSFICMCWIGANGNHKVEIIVGKGYNRRIRKLEGNRGSGQELKIWVDVE